MSEIFHVGKDLLFDIRVIEHGVYRLASGARKFELKHELVEMFTNPEDGKKVKIDQKLYEKFLRTCEAEIRRIACVNKEDLINRITVSLMDWMSDEDADIKSKTYVARELRELHGLDKLGKGDEETAERIRKFVNRSEEIPGPESDGPVD